MCVPIFKQIDILLALVQKWKVCDFVCKKVGIMWEREWSGELRYRRIKKFVQSEKVKKKEENPTPTTLPKTFSTLKLQPQLLHTYFLYKKWSHFTDDSNGIEYVNFPTRFEARTCD
jgi:hypothetical protein